jgi:nicotinamidase/pyrazinamidase
MRALLVTDMLNDFILPDGKLSIGKNGLAIVPFVKDAILQSRSRGEKVIYICDDHWPEDAEFLMFPPHCIEGSEGALVYHELSPQDGDLIIKKRRYSAFYATMLDLALRELGIKELVLVGVCTNICVFYTAIEARNRGYEVTVLADAVATFDQEAHVFALKEMKNVLGVNIVTGGE